MLPIITLSIFGIINLFLGFLRERRVLVPSAIAFLLVSLLAAFSELRAPFHLPQGLDEGMLDFNPLAIGFTAVVLITAILVMPLAGHYSKRPNAQPAEYFSLMMFSLVGAIMMIAYDNLLMLFVGLEILSISMYILTGADKRNLRSNEAAIKYFLMGSFATGIFLFGIALLYGAFGTFNIRQMLTSSIVNYAFQSQMEQPIDAVVLYSLGALFIIIGILFKVSVAPFHFWTPDVYEGAPTAFTAFMSTVVKTAGFAALIKLVSVPLLTAVANNWLPVLYGLVLLTLFISNVTAVVQNSFKRMLAFSSISHAGFLLMAVITNNSAGQSILFYSLVYSLATIAAFAILMAVADARGSEDYLAFNGLGKTNPWLGVVLTISMCSLAGLPLTAGFFGKFYIFSAAAGHPALLVFAVVMSCVSIYYYFRVVIAMYSKQAATASQAPVVTGTGIQAVLWICTILTLLLGIAPQLFNFVFHVPALHTLK